MGSFDGFADGGAEATAGSLGFPDSEGLEEQARTTSPEYDPRGLREALEDSPLEDLEAARDEVRSLLGFLGALMALLESEIDRELAGPLAKTLKRPSLEMGLHLVLLWLSARRSPLVREIYSTFLSTVRVVAAGTLSPAEVLEADSKPGATDHSSEEQPNE